MEDSLFSANLDKNTENQEFSSLHNFDTSKPDKKILEDQDETQSKRTYKHNKINILANEPVNPLYLSVSEAANIGGVQAKTIRRAIQSHDLIYKIVKNRYQIDLRSLIKFLHSKTKLRNKLNDTGIGQLVDKWKK